VSLHPLIARIQPARQFRRLSNAEVMRLSPRDLVRYCDRLLSDLSGEGATHFAVDCLEPIQGSATDYWHGTYVGYATHGCRCERCRAANTAYSREYRTRQIRKAS
jgi:hypothetical protein